MQDRFTHLRALETLQGPMGAHLMFLYDLWTSKTLEFNVVVDRAMKGLPDGVVITKMLSDPFQVTYTFEKVLICVTVLEGKFQVDISDQ